jgi:hypothetical protein
MGSLEPKTVGGAWSVRGVGSTSPGPAAECQDGRRRRWDQYSQHLHPFLLVDGQVKAQLVVLLRGLVEARGEVEQPGLAR